jgi:hypothetical protein
MTDSTDALVGTVGGLVALGILVDASGRIIHNRPRRLRQKKAKRIRFI